MILLAGASLARAGAVTQASKDSKDAVRLVEAASIEAYCNLSLRGNDTWLNGSPANGIESVNILSLAYSAILSSVRTVPEQGTAPDKLPAAPAQSAKATGSR